MYDFHILLGNEKLSNCGIVKNNNIDENVIIALKSMVTRFAISNVKPVDVKICDVVGRDVCDLSLNNKYSETENQ